MAPASTPDPELDRLAAVIDTHRRLLDDDPEALYPAYADALMALAAHLAELGRKDEALGAALDGVRHFQALALAEPLSFGVHLASALNNLANRLAEAGRAADARRAGAEAVALARSALAERPEQARFVLVSALMNRAGRGWDSEEPADPLADMEEAVLAFREGGESMVAYLGVLCEAFHRNAMALGSAGRWDEAVAVRRLTARCFAGESPAAVDHLLALTLERAALARNAAGDAAGAEPLSAEVLVLARRLAAAEPRRYRLFLAQSLGDCADRHYRAGTLAAGLEAALEAITLFQEAAATDAAAAVPPLGMTLETFAAILDALGQTEQAETVRSQRDGLLQALADAQAGSLGPHP